MAINIVNQNEGSYRLFYSSKGFLEGLNVTGYFIFNDGTKSDIFIFDDIGDGIYTIERDFEKQNSAHMEKMGIVVKEDGNISKFEMINIFR